MKVQTILNELQVDSVEDAVAELELAADSLAKGHTAAALPWDESIEAALTRINAELQMLTDTSVYQEAA